MGVSRNFSLDAIRTDGWFERVGEKVGSFEALCSILGERFFAFSLITGARITALTVDRKDPAASIVEFEVSGASAEEGPVTQRLTLERFRRRLVSALLGEEQTHPAPTRETDVEGIQRHIGVRCLLLAPLFGYSLLRLTCEAESSTLGVLQDGELLDIELDALRSALRRCVVEELERVSSSGHADQAGLDLAVVPRAREAAAQSEHEKVVELLGAWLMPLSFFLRTAEGRGQGPEVKGVLGEALGLLGTALVALHDGTTAEQSLRLAVQYAVGTPSAGDVYARMGAAMMVAERFGEAIAPLRRAATLGVDPARVWPALGLAFLKQERYLASWAALQEALAQGVIDPSLGPLQSELRGRLPPLVQWERWREQA
jgi:hypothetical protein